VFLADYLEVKKGDVLYPLFIQPQTELSPVKTGFFEMEDLHGAVAFEDGEEILNAPFPVRTRPDNVLPDDLRHALSNPRLAYNLSEGRANGIMNTFT
jgi:hypothetical protein